VVPKLATSALLGSAGQTDSEREFGVGWASQSHVQTGKMAPEALLRKFNLRQSDSKAVKRLQMRSTHPRPLMA